MAVDRLRKCDNVVALSEELGVHRRLLYKWRQQLEPVEPGGDAPPDLREFTLVTRRSDARCTLAGDTTFLDRSLHRDLTVEPGRLGLSGILVVPRRAETTASMAARENYLKGLDERNASTGDLCSFCRQRHRRLD